MSVSTKFETERAELEVVLASDLFAKSPNLAKMLQYIGHKHFEGKEHLLKEYNIGVDALGRPPDFDPKADSIVRVEAHRLREKLKRYYESEGSDHPVIISLQVGHYIPQFLKRCEISVSAASLRIHDSNPVSTGGSGNGVTSSGRISQLDLTSVDSASEKNSPAPTNLLPFRWRWRHLLAAFVLLIFLAGIAALAPLRTKVNTAEVPPLPQVRPSTSVAANQDEDIRIIAGYSKKEYVDLLGKSWGPDRYYSGGAVLVEPQTFIARASDSALFKTAREGEFSYDIPLKPGTYELRLYFVETGYGPSTLRGGGEVSRLFHIDINGKRVRTDFDVYSDAGGTNIADEQVFKNMSPFPDGYLHLKFSKAIDYPIINAIEIVRSSQGKIQPVRIVAQERSYTDEAGHLWSPDRYFFGGRMITNSQTVEGTTDAGLYSAERYGHFDYAIPVAEGRYGVKLCFAETYFGGKNPGKGGLGSRVFDVYSNGIILLHNFDIFKEAGGENRALDKTFHGLQPNAMGKLMLSFVPVTNYASVKAIEVIDESK